MDPINIEALYETRLIIFIEEKPQSNTYFQVLLDPKQFKKVSLTINELFPPTKDHKCDNPNCKGRQLEVSQRQVMLPDDITSIHRCLSDKCKC